LAAGEGSIQNFAATCRLRLPSKLADIQLAATVLDASTVPPSSTAASTSSYVANANGRSCDTAKLARFLSELSPEVSGSFDTACLFRDNCKSSEAQQHADSQADQTGPAGHSSTSILQALLQDNSCSRTDQQLNPWLIPVVALFSSQADSHEHQQLCLVQKTQHCLGNVLCFSPRALQDDTWCRLILFQVLSCLQNVHSQGLCFGKLSPDSVCLSPDRSAPCQPNQDLGVHNDCSFGCCHDPITSPVCPTSCGQPLPMLLQLIPTFGSWLPVLFMSCLLFMRHIGRHRC